MVGNYAIMSIIVLDFVGITGLARAAPSRQVPGESAKPRAFSGLRESLQVHSKRGVCIELQLEERKLLRLGMVPVSTMSRSPNTFEHDWAIPHTGLSEVLSFLL